MCGIYGMFSSRGNVTMEAVIRCRDRLAHRGPDDAGSWLSPDGRMGLAHRRLSILDVTAAGHQPMTSRDGRYTIVFNGEIYNYRQLRTELEKAGRVFVTRTDTEVLLEAYIAWGEGCLNRLNGMFALAIHDAGDAATSSTLFLARDRTGKKPLYYAHDMSRFEFASELKAMQSGRGMNARALNHYLALGYVPHDMCLTEGVNKLPPAHAARLRADTGALRVWRYWDLPENRPNTEASGEALADHAQRLFVDAVGLRLTSDVPLGVLLSGGLDSSLVVAAAAQQSAKPLQTFTVAFPGSRYDESTHAERVARYFDTEHHVLEVPRPSLDVLDDLAPFVDEPIADSSLLPAFMVSRLTRRHVTVALGGDGGDELFGGYPQYLSAMEDQRRAGWLPGWLLSAGARVAAGLPAGIHGRNRLASWRGGPLQQMVWGSTFFDIGLRRRILRQEWRQEAGFELDEPENWLLGLFHSGRDPVDCMTRTHFKSVLMDDFLVKIDRASMAHGLEMRAPFLDYRLVEFAFGEIPGAWKVGDGETRRIERILAKRMLPPDFEINRKQGFSIPLDEWLRADNCERVRRYAHDLPDIIDAAELERLVAGELRGRANGARLYSLVMLGIASRNNGWTRQ